MDNALTSSFLPVIQLAVTPVILLSGVGALMITLTNRMGRVVDRTRSLSTALRQAPPAEYAHVESQLAILWRRAKLVRVAVTFAGLSMLLSCLLVIAIFIDASVQADYGLQLVVVFISSVLCVTGSLVAFLRDIWISLVALQIEVDRARSMRADGTAQRPEIA
jgi:hypothetical protein